MAGKLVHARKNAPVMIKGRRDFFKYRDLEVTEASGGAMRAQIMSGSAGMTRPTGWHTHQCEGQFIYVLRGWVELEFADGGKRVIEEGDSMFIPGGLPHNETRTSQELEILEVSLPADMGTVACAAPA